jgi:acyl dehydratase
MEQSQVYYEDIEIGNLLPPLRKMPTPRQMVMWAGSSGDFYEIHYDKEFALKLGLPDILVQGGLVASFLAQMITDWIGEYGTLKKLQTVNKQMMFPHKNITCKGKVVNKYIKDNQCLIECEIWAEGGEKSVLVVGNAVVALPAEAQKV